MCNNIASVICKFEQYTPIFLNSFFTKVENLYKIPPLPLVFIALILIASGNKPLEGIVISAISGFWQSS